MSEAYSEKIWSAVIGCLTAMSCPYESNEENGSLVFYDGLRGKLERVRLFMDVKQDRFSVMGRPGLCLDMQDEDEKARMSDLMKRINRDPVISAGNVEFSFDENGEIEIYLAVACDDALPLDEIILESIQRVKNAIDQYVPAICNSLFSEMSPETAYKRCRYTH